MATGQQMLLLLALTVLAVLLPAASANYDPSIFRTYFGCPQCEQSLCPPTPPGCELVKEPGICGCCQTCALQKGEPCGIYTNRCGQGLKCTPPPFALEPLEALFKGEGRCVKETVMPQFSLMGENNQIKRHFEARKRKSASRW